MKHSIILFLGSLQLQMTHGMHDMDNTIAETEDTSFNYTFILMAAGFMGGFLLACYTVPKPFNNIPDIQNGKHLAEPIIEQ